MIYVELKITIDEDAAEFEDVINKVNAIDGVDEVEVVDGSYHEYNVDSDPWWDEDDVVIGIDFSAEKDITSTAYLTDKQTKLRPHTRWTGNDLLSLCPRCHEELSGGKYCSDCGQALELEDES